MFKLFRVVILLSILFVIVVSTWMTERRMAEWERPILVTIFPIIADEATNTFEFTRDVELSDFADVNRFFERESVPYGFNVTPAFRFQLAPVSSELPPDVPDQFSSAGIAWWSLKMRWEVGISVGMRKGRYGIVKAYAKESMMPHNLIVFTHELLHVLGATDKYVLSTGEPIFPHGFANPKQRPLFPQLKAEIMGGRIPLNSFSSKMAGSLEDCRIGRLTGEEIGFLSQLMD
jgi:hypothetical protein